MMSCEALNVNYILTSFVRAIKIVSLQEYSSRVILVDEKKLISAVYNLLYAIEFSTNENALSIHIFRAINMKVRVILN